MNHDQIRELLFDYYDNELRGETAAEVKSHIAGCRECASNIRGWASTARLVFDPERPASEVFVRRVMNCVRPQRSAIPWLFPALSTLAFAGFLFVVLGFHREEPLRHACQARLPAGRRLFRARQVLPRAA